MTIRTFARTLSAAALLAVTVVSVSAQQADAKPIGPRQTDGPVVIDDNLGGLHAPCGIQGSAVNQPQYDWVYYSPGNQITVNGQTYFCGTFGRWLAY